MIEFDRVSCERGGRAVLRELSLSVEAGETVVLLGRSGSGKTTALRLVNALLWPSAGAVRVAGRATTAWDPFALRRSIGYVIQDAGLLPHRTVAENIGLVPLLLGRERRWIATRVAELLDQVGLSATEFGSRRPVTLSGGQRQRVGIARALAAEPPVLLLDEPFGALDPVTRLELQRLFARLRREAQTTCLLVTHDVREALALGHRVGVLRDGRLELVTTPAGFRAAAGGEARAFLEVLDGAVEA